MTAFSENDTAPIRGHSVPYLDKPLEIITGRLEVRDILQLGFERQLEFLSRRSVWHHHLNALS